MGYVWGALAGAVWGCAVGYLNSKLTVYFLKKNDASKLLLSNILKTLVDIAALSVVFLLRNVLPFELAATLTATAVALSLVTLFTSLSLAKKMK